MDLYEKYQDAETSPAAEKIDKIIMRFHQSFTYYYFIEANGIKYRNKGYAQKAIQLVEEIHGSSNWELETVLQEKGNCYLYEKMGYHQTGNTFLKREK